MATRFLCLLLLAITLVTPATAADHVTVAKTLAADVIVPRYEALAKAAEAQAEAWKNLCAAPSPAALEAVKSAYHATADAWSAAEIIRYGPVSEDFRAERLSYWPERKNATQRGLAQLLKPDSQNNLSPDSIRGASAAVQGLPALERLLFTDPPADEKAFAGSPDNERRCAVGRAIADNVRALAEEIRDGWSDPKSGLASQLFYAPLADEVVRRLATDVVSGFQIMRDVKLLPVLGPEIARANPKLAEGWRSERSSRALALNLKTTLVMAEIMLEGQSEEGAAGLYNVRQALRVAEGLPPLFGPMAADRKERPQLILLFDALGFSRDRLLIEVPAALGIAMGFNSLDGD
ncbi:MAG: imelysin family protein [Parvibaculaceae bacterium]